MIYEKQNWEKVAALMLWKKTRGRRPVTVTAREFSKFRAANLTLLVTGDGGQSLTFQLLTKEEAAKLREHQARIASEVTP
jgi:hypothetical protein